MKKRIAGLLAAAVLGTAAHVQAADYAIDTQGAHAFVQFRVKHLGYSWLYGRFNNFDGSFTFDEKDPKKNKVEVTVDVTSLDSNHAERDKHLRSDDFLNAAKFPKATFVSTAYKATGENTAEVTGNLTLHGVTKPITIDVEHIGAGADPWGGYRTGFEGRATIKPEEWGIAIAKLGPASEEVELFLSVEGIRKGK
jgi:polyisoprenoid-binding protein YceI